MIVLGSCKDKCETESCGGGRYIINGNCECPPGSYWVGDRCVEKNPGHFWIDSTSCNCITNQTKFNFVYLISDMENPAKFDTRFNRFDVKSGINYPGRGGTGSWFYFDNKRNTMYTSVFYEAFFGKQCNENSFAFGQFYNVGGHVRNKLKLRVYSYSVPEHEIRVAYPDKESYSKATDSCTIWMSNGL
jgi:hypothetical protein